MLLGVTESYPEPDPGEGEVSWNWSGDSLDSLSLSLQQGRLEYQGIKMPVRVHVNFTVNREEDKFKARAMEVVKTSKVE